jgi:drug/metabolite transporter (DMT)-like permease
MAFYTMIFAGKAHINVGIIVTIWSVNPMFVAVADYFVNGQKLQYFHILGMSSMVVCSVLISLNSIVNKTEVADTSDTALDEAPTVPVWVPILFGLLTPVCFTTNGLLTKHLTNTVGFNPSRLCFNSYFIVNLLVAIVAVFYFQSHPFDMNLFWLGLAGSIVNTLGITCIQNALTLGPIGPVSALSASSTFLLVVVEAIKWATLPSAIQMIALVFGLYGAFVLVIPEVFAKIFCFCCFSKLHGSRTSGN